jgi:hypothetical protein
MRRSTSKYSLQQQIPSTPTSPLSLLPLILHFLLSSINLDNTKSSSLMELQKFTSHEQKNTTQHLITHHGFNVIAAEAGWPEIATCAVVEMPLPLSMISVMEPGENIAFKCFPTWMGRSHGVHDFVEWLRGYNKGLRKTGFCTVLEFYTIASMEWPQLVASFFTTMNFWSRSEPS